MTDESGKTAMQRALDLALERVSGILEAFTENPERFINGWKSPSGDKVGGIYGPPPSMLGDKMDGQRVGMANGYATAIGDVTKALGELRAEIEQGAHP